MGDHRKPSGCPPGYRKLMRRVNEVTHIQEPIPSTGSNWLSGEERSRLEAVQRDWRSSRPKVFSPWNRFRLQSERQTHAHNAAPTADEQLIPAQQSVFDKNKLSVAKDSVSTSAPAETVLADEVIEVKGIAAEEEVKVAEQPLLSIPVKPEKDEVTEKEAKKEEGKERFKF